VDVVTGGPDDGADLYPPGQEPCLICGHLIGVDWDGLLVWHYRGKELHQLSWCPGSRQRVTTDFLDA
jgi:hypothetical protein